MKYLPLALILVLPLMLVGAERDEAALAVLRNFTKTSKVPQADQNGVQANGFKITDPDEPFLFQNVGRIRTITRITITVTLRGGETGEGGFDRGQLTLALDGFDTGLLLDGFGSAVTTQSLSGVPINEDQIRAALKADGKLDATIIDDDPGDNGITGSSANATTLEITGKRRS
jgi:hypothetical protein